MAEKAGFTRAEKKEIFAVIKKGREEGLPGSQIADRLNKEGYTTAFGNKWSEPNISTFAINNGLPRRVNTVAGAAGTTGTKHRPSVKKVQKNKPSDRTATTGKTGIRGDKLELMRDILTSNLSEETQRLLVNKLTEF